MVLVTSKSADTTKIFNLHAEPGTPDNVSMGAYAGEFLFRSVCIPKAKNTQHFDTLYHIFTMTSREIKVFDIPVGPSTDLDLANVYTLQSFDSDITSVKVCRKQRELLV